MGILQTLGLRQSPAVREALTAGPDPVVVAEVDSLTFKLEKAQEAIADLQRDNAGWARIGAETVEVDHSTLVSNANLVRAFSGMNPLMVRAKAIRGAYVWGAGCTITAPDNGQIEGRRSQDVSAIVDAYVKDAGNKAAVFGEQARMDLEGDLFDDGNVFVGHWVDPLLGTVMARVIPFDEVTDKLTAPGDRATTHYYLREWTEQLNTEGTPRRMAAWYPDIDFDPINKPSVIKGKPVLWPGKTTPGYGGGAAICHVKVNGAGRSRKWGVGDGFPAIPYARMYKEFLEDCWNLYKALSKIARVISSKTDKTQTARAAAQATNGPAGGTLYGSDLQANTPSYSGIEPVKGRPFASMVAAATGVAVTILTADPGQEGARAVAETLDKPMRLTFENRQKLWAEFIRASVGYRIKQSVKAPRGELKGRIEQVRDRTQVVFADETDQTVTVDFPPIEDDNLTILMDAVKIADETGKMPPVEILRLILRAFNVENADDIIDDALDDDGNWIDPNQTAADAAGQAAANALRNGGNPADVL
ncbi:hypothetical protein [Citricoccus sp. K5]|uniref:hypothetical protein n=1 Tax=Citricoccus sp. K5 TaxID=2653135 RepID=UPI0012F3E560|nr:hypothetical protein [Citricoccus sp. K5]VXA92602.1 conserved hypothetical protein [Citricoccus sp. K5]VXA95071.1 conserved hypothetical protein [Citricoccus sp. K5]